MAVSARAASPIDARGLAGRRVGTAALLGVIVVVLALAVPALRPVGREIREMNPGWVVAAVALELASCLSFVAIFRAFFERVNAGDARALAWTSMASGVLLPGGGVGGLAIGGWLMRLAGAPTAWIVRRSSALFFFTSAINGAAIIGAGLLLVTGAAGPHDFDRAVLPLLVAAALTLAIAGAPWIARGRSATLVRLDGVFEGILDAQRAARHPSWRLGGAVGYLGFDIAVLWATFSAIGHSPPVAVLVLGYTIGYAANALPIPRRRRRAGRRTRRGARALRRRADPRRRGGARLPRDRSVGAVARRPDRLRPPAPATGAPARDRGVMTALALMLGPTPDGWAVYLTNGREVRRFRGLSAKRKALRFIRRASTRDLLG